MDVFVTPFTFQFTLQEVMVSFPRLAIFTEACVLAAHVIIVEAGDTISATLAVLDKGKYVIRRFGRDVAVAKPDVCADAKLASE